MAVGAEQEGEGATAAAVEELCSGWGLVSRRRVVQMAGRYCCWNWKWRLRRMKTSRLSQYHAGGHLGGSHRKGFRMLIKLDGC